MRSALAQAEFEDQAKEILAQLGYDKNVLHCLVIRPDGSGNPGAVLVIRQNIGDGFGALDKVDQHVVDTNAGFHATHPKIATDRTRRPAQTLLWRASTLSPLLVFTPWKAWNSGAPT